MTRQPTPSILDDVLTTDASRPTAIRNASIKVDGGTQMRAQLDPATVQEYADAMGEAGWGKFPPIIAYYDGSDYWLADGFHRLSAWRSIANWSDAMIPADVRSGTRRDAILHAAGANASHGLRRTNADKRRAVETLLRDDEWAKWSNMEIGRRCNVSEGTVRNIRGELERTSQITKSDERHGADGRTTNTANIGAKSQPQPSTPKQFAAAVKSATWNGTQPDILPPTNAPLPAWAEEPISKPGQSTADYLAYRDQANARGEAYLNLKDWRQWLDNDAPEINGDDDLAPPVNAYAAFPMDEDGRIPAARGLINLYRSVIASEEQYGQLTGRFSDTLAVKRDLSAMIGHLEHLIAIIEHPEEDPPAAD